MAGFPASFRNRLEGLLEPDHAAHRPGTGSHELHLRGLFSRDGAGQRPFAAHIPPFQRDPHWRDLLLFHEYFHQTNENGTRIFLIGLISLIFIRLIRVNQVNLCPIHIGDATRRGAPTNE
jgi:hypothetical protein